jgi:hypothetical protein
MVIKSATACIRVLAVARRMTQPEPHEEKSQQRPDEIEDDLHSLPQFYMTGYSAYFEEIANRNSFVHSNLELNPVRRRS